MKKLQIRTRLLGGFVCVIVLSTIITMISILALSRTQKSYDQTINQPINQATTLIKARLHINVLGKYTRDMLLDDDGTNYAEYKTKFKETQVQLEEEIAYLKQNVGSQFDEANQYYDKIVTWISSAPDSKYNITLSASDIHVTILS